MSRLNKFINGDVNDSEHANVKVGAALPISLRQQPRDPETMIPSSFCDRKELNNALMEIKHLKEKVERRDNVIRDLNREVALKLVSIKQGVADEVRSRMIAANRHDEIRLLELEDSNAILEARLKDQFAETLAMKQKVIDEYEIHKRKRNEYESFIFTLQEQVRDMQRGKQTLESLYASEKSMNEIMRNTIVELNEKVDELTGQIEQLDSELSREQGLRALDKLSDSSILSGKGYFKDEPKVETISRLNSQKQQAASQNAAPPVDSKCENLTVEKVDLVNATDKSDKISSDDAQGSSKRRKGLAKLADANKIGGLLELDEGACEKTFLREELDILRQQLNDEVARGNLAEAKLKAYKQRYDKLAVELDTLVMSLASVPEIIGASEQKNRKRSNSVRSQNRKSFALTSDFKSQLQSVVINMFASYQNKINSPTKSEGQFSSDSYEGGAGAHGHLRGENQTHTGHESPSHTTTPFFSSPIRNTSVHSNSSAVGHVGQSHTMNSHVVGAVTSPIQQTAPASPNPLSKPPQNGMNTIKESDEDGEHDGNHLDEFDHSFDHSFGNHHSGRHHRSHRKSTKPDKAKDMQIEALENEVKELKLNISSLKAENSLVSSSFASLQISHQQSIKDSKSKKLISDGIIGNLREQIEVLRTQIDQLNIELAESRKLAQFYGGGGNAICGIGEIAADITINKEDNDGKNELTVDEIHVNDDDSVVINDGLVEAQIPVDPLLTNDPLEYSNDSNYFPSNIAEIAKEIANLSAISPIIEAKIENLDGEKILEEKIQELPNPPVEDLIFSDNGKVEDNFIPRIALELSVMSKTMFPDGEFTRFASTLQREIKDVDKVTLKLNGTKHSSEEIQKRLKNCLEYMEACAKIRNRFVLEIPSSASTLHSRYLVRCVDTIIQALSFCLSPKGLIAEVEYGGVNVPASVLGAYGQTLDEYITRIDRSPSPPMARTGSPGRDKRVTSPSPRNEVFSRPEWVLNESSLASTTKNDFLSGLDGKNVDFDRIAKSTASVKRALHVKDQAKTGPVLKYYVFPASSDPSEHAGDNMEKWTGILNERKRLETNAQEKELMEKKNKCDKDMPVRPLTAPAPKQTDDNSVTEKHKDVFQIRKLVSNRPSRSAASPRVNTYKEVIRPDLEVAVSFQPDAAPSKTISVSLPTVKSTNAEDQGERGTIYSKFPSSLQNYASHRASRQRGSQIEPR